jgi:hypothetical protein
MKLLTLLVVFLTLIGCHKSYKIENNQVIYYYYNDGSELQHRVLNNADSKSFKALQSGYAIDKNHAFYRGEILPLANPLNLEVFADVYAKDNKHVYFGDSIILGAESESFELIENSVYSKDRNDYYFFGTPLHVSDKPSFVLFDSNYGYWAKDKSFYYFKDLKLPLKDYQSFTPIGEGYAKDRFKVYYEHIAIDGADPDTFKALPNEKGEDKFGKYRRETKLIDISKI